MNKLLTITLIVSAMASVVPTQAVVETRSQTQTVVVEKTTGFESSQQAPVTGEKKQTKARALFNRKAVIAAVAVGAAATATYLYGTLYSTAANCTNVAHAYCAGSDVAPASLEVCKDYLPLVPVIGCWFK